MPIELNGADEATVGPIRDALKAAPKNSPAFTGTPTAPTPAASDNSTKLATTAFVLSEIASSGGGGGSGDLLAANNLSELTNFATARANLGLGNVDNTSNATEREATRTLTNATLGSGTVITSAEMTLGSDTTGDLYYRSSGGALARLPIGSNGRLMQVVSGLPTWVTPDGIGDVTGPLTATDNAIPRFNGTTGDALQDSLVTIDDNGKIIGVASASGYASINIAHGTAPTSPVNGDFWTTTAGFFARINGTTVGPFGAGGGGGLTNFTESVNSTSPNATIPVVQLLATNAATNVDVALTPKGTGALTAQIATSTSVGGNKRGANSIDWQTVRSASTQVASGAGSTLSGGQNNQSSGAQSFVGGGDTNSATGTSSSVSGGKLNSAGGYCSVAGGQNNSAGGSYSSIGGGAFNSTGNYGAVIGGDNNSATGTSSVVLGGSLNTASGDFSNASGLRAITRGIYGAEARASGYFASQGDAQKSGFILRRATTDATITDLSTDGGTPATANRIILPNNSTYCFKGQVVARASGGDSKVFNFRGGIKRGANAAATALVGMVTITDGFDAGAMGWAVTIDADTTNGSLRFRVTGAAATNIRWVATVETAEVVF